MELNTIRIEKVMVKSCTVCGLNRIPKGRRQDDEYKGEPGIKVTVKTEEEEYSWREGNVTEMCDICNQHIMKCNNVMTANKLSSASVLEPKYVLPVKKLKDLVVGDKFELDGEKYLVIKVVPDSDELFLRDTKTGKDIEDPWSRDGQIVQMLL